MLGQLGEKTGALIENVPVSELLEETGAVIETVPVLEPDQLGDFAAKAGYQKTRFLIGLSENPISGGVVLDETGGNDPPVLGDTESEPPKRAGDHRGKKSPGDLPSRPANVTRFYIVGRPEAGDVAIGASEPPDKLSEGPDVDIGRMARPDLDEAGADAHVVTPENSEEKTAMYVDANGYFPEAGRKPRGLSPEQIERRRTAYGKVLAEYPNQPAHEADDVAELIARMMTDRHTYVPFTEMINALNQERRTGRTDLPTLKNCLQRNWRAVHGSALARGVRQ